MKLLAVDGTNVAMRYAFALLGKRVGEPSPGDIDRVMAGAERAMLECGKTAGASHAVVALDSPGSWRRDLYPEYKANREGGDTGSWSTSLGGYLTQRGWTCLAAPSFEADDGLATTARRAVEAGNGVVVLSSDSDLLALASDEVGIYQFGSKGEPRYCLRSPEWVSDRYGIRWGQLPLYKALVGEPGDNLPGVKGCGPVKARAVLRDYPTEADIIESGIVARREFELMLRLVELRMDVPLGPIIPRKLMRP